MYKRQAKGSLDDAEAAADDTETAERVRGEVEEELVRAAAAGAFEQARQHAAGDAGLEARLLCHVAAAHKSPPEAGQDFCRSAERLGRALRLLEAQAAPPRPPLRALAAEGYELVLTRMISEAVSIPVIASGGAGTPAHLYEVLEEGKADAALVASMVHYGEYLSLIHISEPTRTERMGDAVVWF